MMSTSTDHRPAESGNVFFYIFMAIALLGALSFAVSQSTRQTGRGLDDDRAKLAASEIISYGDTVAKAVGQLRLRGIQPYQISFAHASAHVDYGVYDTNPRSEVFNPQGGGVIYRAPPILAGNGPPLTYNYVGAYAIDRVGLTGCLMPASEPAACSELLLSVQGLNQTVCQMVNSLLGIHPRDATPPDDDALPVTPLFAGNASGAPNPFTFTETIADSGTSTMLAGRTAGCYYNPGSASHVYYQVLIAR